jgi:hypothetical protein
MDMEKIQRIGQFAFTGLGGSLAAFAPIFPNPSLTTILTAAAASAAIWAGLFQRPPWTPQAPAALHQP